MTQTVPVTGSTAPLTVARLVAEPGLGLSVVVAGNLDLAVTGAHTSEIDHPQRWLRPHSVLLTTGLRFLNSGGNPPDADELVVELLQAQVPALLFGVGVHFTTIPAGLVNAAKRHQMTLIAVDLATPFHVVEDFVLRWTMSAQTVVLERTVRLQDDLLRTLASPDPVVALVKRLAALTRGSATLYDGTGATVAATGEAPHRLIWNELAHTQRGRPFTVGRWTACAQDIDVPGARMTVSIASRNASVIYDIGEALTRTAAHVLAAANGIRSVALTHERAEASRIMAALESGIPGGRVSQTWARLRPFKIAAGSPLRMLVGSARSATPALTARRPGDELVEFAYHLGMGIVLDIALTDDEGAPPVRALVADDTGTEEWLERLGRDYVAGLSGAFTDLTAIPERIREAQAAHHLARTRRDRGHEATVLRMDEIDLASWVIASRGDQAVAAMIERQLSPIADAPDVRTTLVHYLAHDQNLKETARALFVHVNTIRYRLNKAEDLLGAPLSRASTVANLYLALQDEVIGLRAQLKAH